MRSDWHKKLKDRRKEVGVSHPCLAALAILHQAADALAFAATAAYIAELMALHAAPASTQVRELERRKAEDVQRREQQAVLAAAKARSDAERAAKTK